LAGFFALFITTMSGLVWVVWILGAVLAGMAARNKSVKGNT
jgi:uncharacterized membrane protein YecN with MAPEG domain